MRDTLMTAFVSWSEAAHTSSVARSNVVVAGGSVPVCVTLAVAVDPVSVLNTCVAVSSGRSVTALTRCVT